VDSAIWTSQLGTTLDPKSIMCYQIPGELTKDGIPIAGGKDIDTFDAAFAAKIYPKKSKPAKLQNRTEAASTARL
jgi:hypothetical protein